MKKILVAPLNWGLGHATRCIPIINALLENGYQPAIASDGVALALLQHEFPELETFELPSYKIKYAKKAVYFKWKMIAQLPNIVEAIKLEQKAVSKIIKEHHFDGIISDNRLGAYSKKVPSVFITHQLNVLTGKTSWITTTIHDIFIKKHKQCWVPDVEGETNLSGKLGHIKKQSLPLKYIGTLSRLQPKKLEKKYELLVLLSGPEPQRTMLETILIRELESYKKPVLFIKGLVENEQIIEQKNNITFYNYMSSQGIENAFNESDKVLCRSGYTTLMDLAKLKKTAFLIPTPGQFEQEYLAKKLDKEKIAPTCKQDDFTIEKLDSLKYFSGFTEYSSTVSWKKLFEVFE